MSALLVDVKILGYQDKRLMDNGQETLLRSLSFEGQGTCRCQDIRISRLAHPQVAEVRSRLEVTC